MKKALYILPVVCLIWASCGGEEPNNDKSSKDKADELTDQLLKEMEDESAAADSSALKADTLAADTLAIDTMKSK